VAVLEEPVREVQLVRNYIDGEWVESAGEMREVTNPATGRVIARVPASTGSEVAAAVRAARAAFREWRSTPPAARVRYLFRLKELLEENFEVISRIQTQEHGKVIDESRGETRRGIENIEVACGIPSLMMGYNLEDVAAGMDEYAVYRPMGVFGVIAPFNFPFMVPLWSAPYAVATGNCIVVKPSDEAPLSQMKLTELAEEAGFPPGVWNVVNGREEVVSGLLDDPDVAGITFVGSTGVARFIYGRCGAAGKRCLANGAAKNFILVMPDCDVDNTVVALMSSFFGNTGQRCLAGANLVVVGDDDRFYKDFVDRVVAAASRIVVGYGLDEGVQMGPLKGPEKKERVAGFIESGLAQGARLLLDGRRPAIRGGYPATCFLGPTVFGDVTPAMRIAREEIFGPVMSIMRTRSLEEAVALANASPFGNAAAIFTTSGKTAREFQYRVAAGNIGINVGIAAPMAFFPFGGMKDSFFGVLHAQGREMIRFFTDVQVVIQRWF